MPGFDSLSTYTQFKYVTLAALQNAMNNINNRVINEISNIQTEIDNIQTTNQQHVNKYAHYRTSHTDFMYQRNSTKKTTVVEVLLYSETISHINEKVIKSYRFKH